MYENIAKATVCEKMVKKTPRAAKALKRNKNNVAAAWITKEIEMDIPAAMRRPLPAKP